MHIQRPYKHTITIVTGDYGATRVIVLGTYSTAERAIAAAQKADAANPDLSREVRLRNRTYRNTYLAPVKEWKP